MRKKPSRRKFLKQAALGTAAAGASVLGLASCSSKRGGQEQGKPLYTFDLTYTLRLNRDNPRDLRKIYDHSHFVSSLQGLVNRKQPRLYMFLMGPESATQDMTWLPQLPSGTPTLDHFWLRFLQQEDKWLANYRQESLPDCTPCLRRSRMKSRGLWSMTKRFRPHRMWPRPSRALKTCFAYDTIPTLTHSING